MRKDLLKNLIERVKKKKKEYSPEDDIERRKIEAEEELAEEHKQKMMDQGVKERYDQGNL